MKRGAVRGVLLCLFVLLALILLACQSASAASLCGRWETELNDRELGTLSMVYHFTEDGEIFIEQKQGDTIPFSIPFGSYSVDGNRVTIESDGTEETFTFSVQGSELTLSREGEESLIFHRI